MNKEDLFRRVANVGKKYDDLHKRLLSLEQVQKNAEEAASRKAPGAKGTCKAAVPIEQYHPEIRDCRKRKGRVLSALRNVDLDQDALQFLSNKAYSVEGAIVEIDVIRVGRCRGECTVAYETRDRAAKAGKKYVATSGKLSFGHMESAKTIRVPLLQDDQWLPVCTFEVLLVDPVEAVLDPNKSVCRVTVADDDRFPSNNVKKFIDTNAIEAIPVIKMLRAFFEFAFRLEGVGRKVKMVFIGDQVQNACTLFANYVKAYLINSVLKGVPGPDGYIAGDRFSTLYLLAGVNFAPCVILFLWNRYKASCGIENRIKGFLQEAVVRTYFNLKDEIRADVRPSHVVEVLMNDTDSLVHKTYDSVMKLSVVLGAMFMNFYFVLDKTPWAVWILVWIVFAFSVLLWYEAPRRSKIDAKNVKMSANELLTDKLNTVSHHFRLISDYDMVSSETDTFDQMVEKNDDVNTLGAKNGVRPKYVPQVLTVSLAAVFMVIGGREVLEGAMELGTFVVVMGIITSMAKTVEGGHNVVLVLLKSMKSLGVLTQFLSLEVDIPERMQCSTLQRKEQARMWSFSHQEKASAPAGSPLKDIPSTDLMCIEMSDVDVHYGTNKVLTGVSISLRQGTITAITGAHSSGKRTIIKVLSGVHVPNGGSSFVPAHLRVLHLGRFPEIFARSTLTDNLTYGHACTPERVEAIMRDFINPTESVILTLLQQEREGKFDPHWSDKMTQTDIQIIHLARAVVFNPGFLAMERIMDVLNAEKALHVLGVIRKHVDERGLYEPGEMSSRRPRTVIFSTLKNMALMPGDVGDSIATEVDNVWVIDMDGGVQTHDLTR